MHVIPDYHYPLIRFVLNCRIHILCFFIFSSCIDKDFFDDEFQKLDGQVNTFDINIPETANFLFTQKFGPEDDDSVVNKVVITNTGIQNIIKLDFNIKFFEDASKQNLLLNHGGNIDNLEVGGSNSITVSNNLKVNISEDQVDVEILNLQLEDSLTVTNELLLNIPSLILAKIQQQKVTNSGGMTKNVENSISIQNNTSSDIESISFLLEFYSSSEFLQDNLQVSFVDSINNLKPLVESAPTIFNNSYDADLGAELILFEVLETGRSIDHPLGGYFQGTYTLKDTLGNETINSAIAYITHTGKGEFRLTESPAFEKITGSLSRNGSFIGEANALSDSIASNSISLTDDDLFSGSFIIGKMQLYDTVQFELNKLQF